MSLATKLIAPIDPVELAVRMCEKSYGLRRPAGMTAQQTLDAMEEDCRAGWLRAANEAMAYWKECIGTMRTIQ